MTTAAERIGKTAATEIFTDVANAISLLDLDQEDRERVASAVIGALRESRIGSLIPHPETFELVASDPLVPCVGYDRPDGTRADCPARTVIRLGWHLRSAPDGRSAAWKQRAPYGEIRCVSCGSMQFNSEYRDNVLARET